MLTRRAAAYSSFCSQVFVAYLQPFCSQFTLEVCAIAENHKKSLEIHCSVSSRSFNVISVDAP